MSDQPDSPAILRKVANVPQPPDEAFRLFTESFAEWWPLTTHSVGFDAATGVVFEPRVGGRIVEQLAGDTAVWGTVTVWEPPSRVRFTWHPGAPVEQATEVEVAFRPGDPGTTVTLVHSGWDRRPDGTDARAAYDTGWVVVLGRYATHAHALTRPSVD